jgi:hypothetical protein
MVNCTYHNPLDQHTFDGSFEVFTAEEVGIPRFPKMLVSYCNTTHRTNSGDIDLKHTVNSGYHNNKNIKFRVSEVAILEKGTYILSKERQSIKLFTKSYCIRLKNKLLIKSTKIL